MESLSLLSNFHVAHVCSCSRVVFLLCIIYVCVSVRLLISFIKIFVLSILQFSMSTNKRPVRREIKRGKEDSRQAKARKCERKTWTHARTTHSCTNAHRYGAVAFRNMDRRQTDGKRKDAAIMLMLMLSTTSTTTAGEVQSERNSIIMNASTQIDSIDCDRKSKWMRSNERHKLFLTRFCVSRVSFAWMPVRRAFPFSVFVFVRLSTAESKAETIPGGECSTNTVTHSGGLWWSVITTEFAVSTCSMCCPVEYIRVVFSRFLELSPIRDLLSLLLSIPVKVFTVKMISDGSGRPVFVAPNTIPP